jgi:hypothetical protein
MTRDERAARREQRLKDALAATRRERAKREAQQRAAERATRAKRRQRVGTLADAAGLLVWNDTTLAGLFQILATLRATPDPVAVLESLLADTALTALTPAAAGPFCLPSAAASDSSAVSQGGGGDFSPDRGNNVAQLGVSRGEKRQGDLAGEAAHGACGLDAHGL